jgi:hypothetical protein
MYSANRAIGILSTSKTSILKRYWWPRIVIASHFSINANHAREVIKQGFTRLECSIALSLEPTPPRRLGRAPQAPSAVAQDSFSGSGDDVSRQAATTHRRASYGRLSGRHPIEQRTGRLKCLIHLRTSPSPARSRRSAPTAFEDPARRHGTFSAMLVWHKPTPTLRRSSGRSRPASATHGWSIAGGHMGLAKQCL